MNATFQARSTVQETTQNQAQGTEQAKPVTGPTFVARADILERDKEFVIYADLPGVAKEGLTLSVEKNRLTLIGEVALATHGKLKRQEYEVGNYQRSFDLSDKVNPSEITAKLENGLLEVTLPKKPEMAPQKITVN